MIRLVASAGKTSAKGEKTYRHARMLQTGGASDGQYQDQASDRAASSAKGDAANPIIAIKEIARAAFIVVIHRINGRSRPISDRVNRKYAQASSPVSNVLTTASAIAPGRTARFTSR